MKESKLDWKFRVAPTVIIVGSWIVDYYVHDRDLRWVFISFEGLFLGVWIGVAMYHWWLQRKGYNL